MKQLLVAFSLFIAFHSHSQITVTSSNMPVSGDTLRFSTALLDSSILLNYQRSGANQTWIFDSLRVISQTVQNFVSSSQTPYNAIPTNRIGLLFADTLSLGPNSVTNVYNFINSTSSDFSIDYRAATLPFVGSPIPIQIPYQNKDEVFQFPLDYLDRDSSDYDFVFNNMLPPLYYGSAGYRINEVDAWGSVTTPYGTFNTLRVVTDMVSLDSISFSGQNIAIPSHLRTYQWIANGERIPVMTVNGLVIAGTFVPNSVEFRDSARVVEPLLPTIALFNADTTSVVVNDLLDFNNLSIGATSFQWDFTPNTVNYTRGSSTTRSISVTFQDTGRYSVRLIATGGSDSDTLERIDYINVTPAPFIPSGVSFNAEGDTAVTNENFTIYNSSSFGTSFSWEITPGTFTNNGVSRPTFDYQSGTSRLSSDSVVVRFNKDGFYSVRLNATENGELKFESKIDIIFARFPVGLAEQNLELNSKISFAPNPVKSGSALTVKVENSIQLQSFQVYSIDGKLVEESIATNAHKMSVEAPRTSGVYFYNFVTDKGSVIKKIIVE